MYLFCICIRLVWLIWFVVLEKRVLPFLAVFCFTCKESISLSFCISPYSDNLDHLQELILCSTMHRSLYNSVVCLFVPNTSVSNSDPVNQQKFVVKPRNTGALIQYLKTKEMLHENIKYFLNLTVFLKNRSFLLVESFY